MIDLLESQIVIRPFGYGRTVAVEEGGDEALTGVDRLLEYFEGAFDVAGFEGPFGDRYALHNGVVDLDCLPVAVSSLFETPADVTGSTNSLLTGGETIDGRSEQGSEHEDSDRARPATGADAMPAGRNGPRENQHHRAEPGDDAALVAEGDGQERDGQREQDGQSRPVRR